MNFPEFLRQRDEILRDRKDVLDCGDTNLYAALTALAPAPTAPPQEKVHRCHLSTQWCERFGFSPTVARRAFISRGVRDSLSRLFQHFGRLQARAWLPADNYPVFHELAQGTGLRVSAFETLPQPNWPTAAPAAGPELVLVTSPLKPLGRWLNDADVAALQRWLAAHPKRRVILDSVYTFGTRFDRSTLRLLESNQAVLLHSLTKGWLQPRLFGVAVVPEADAATLAPAFRADPPSQESLAHARELLGRQADIPQRVGLSLLRAHERLRAALPPRLAGRILVESPATTYFVPVSVYWSSLLQDANILGVPASVFGAAHDDITILSTLGFCR